MDAFPAERVALELIQGGTESKQREVQLQSGIEQLTRATEEMVAWVDRLREYVDDVLAGRRDMDAAMGRKLMDLVTSASSQMQPKKFENVLKNSKRDYMMISYLAQLAKTQLALHERMISA